MNFNIRSVAIKPSRRVNQAISDKKRDSRMLRKTIFSSCQFKKVFVYLQMSAIDEMFEEETDFGACEEIMHLNEGLSETEKIQEELQSTMKYLKKLSAKYGSGSTNENYLCTFTPGSIWSLLACNDLLINERRQKHDLNSPQQHHKVQEINDGPSSSYSSTASKSRIINHLTEVNARFIVEEGAGGDSKSPNRKVESNHQDDYVLSSPAYDFIKRHRFKVNLLKIKNEIQSATMEVKKVESKSTNQSQKTKNYFFKNETARTDTPTKCVKYHRRNITGSPSYGSPRPNLQAKRRQSIYFTVSQMRRTINEF